MGLETGNGDPHVQCTYKTVEYSSRGYITLLFLWGVHFVPMSTCYPTLWYETANQKHFPHTKSQLYHSSCQSGKNHELWRMVHV